MVVTVRIVLGKVGITRLGGDGFGDVIAQLMVEGEVVPARVGPCVALQIHEGPVDLVVIACNGEVGDARHIVEVARAEDDAEMLQQLIGGVEHAARAVARDLESVGVLDAHAELLGVLRLVGGADEDRAVARHGLVRHHEARARDAAEEFRQLVGRIAHAVGDAAVDDDDRLGLAVSGDDKLRCGGARREGCGNQAQEHGAYKNPHALERCAGGDDGALGKLASHNSVIPYRGQMISSSRQRPGAMVRGQSAYASANSTPIFLPWYISAMRRSAAIWSPL